MIIQTKYPFDLNKHKVYLTRSSDGRDKCYVYENDILIYSTAYTRYIAMTEIVHGYIPEGYEVDHIDGNFNNNSLNNLQIITKEMNLLKQQYETGSFKLLTELICPVCNKRFTIEYRFYKSYINFRKYFYCSRSCSGKGTFMYQNSDIVSSPYRGEYKYLIGHFINLDDIRKAEQIMDYNGVKYIKKYR